MASAAVCLQGLRAPLLLSSRGKAMQGEPLISAKTPTSGVSTSGLRIRAATQGGGTRSAKKLKVIQEGEGKFRDKVTDEAPAIKLLARVEQLRLLTKAERSGLLSAAENAGLSLSSIEKFGLLSKAEKFGALSAATDPKTPALLLVAALGLLVLGPAFVYFVPEDSTPLVVVQVVVALVSVLGGSAAFAASSFVSALQSTD
ncbi:unnamed protein product [Calypogeia fissa]